MCLPLLPALLSFRRSLWEADSGDLIRRDIPVGKETTCKGLMIDSLFFSVSLFCSLSVLLSLSVCLSLSFSLSDLNIVIW